MKILINSKYSNVCEIPHAIGKKKKSRKWRIEEEQMKGEIDYAEEQIFLAVCKKVPLLKLFINQSVLCHLFICRSRYKKKPNQCVCMSEKSSI